MKLATIALIAAAVSVTSTAALAQQTETNTTRRATGEGPMNRDTANRNSMDRDRDRDRGGEKISAEEFAKKAGAGGAAEVEMGKLGAQKATNAEVKAYAQKMVADHSKTNKELMSAAKAKGVEVPTEPDMMHKGMAKKFEHQEGDHDFNHDFMQQMVRDHKAQIELFKAAANDSTLDPEFRALARKTLPTLEEHLEHAQQLEAKLAKE